MISVQIIEQIITLITFVFAYLFSVTLAGAFRAWYTNKVGDSSAAASGLLTLNPIAHIDPLGLLFIVLFRFGWGKTIPIDADSITGRFRPLKLVFAYLSDAVAYVAIAIAGLVALLAMFGQRIFHVIIPVLNEEVFSHAKIAHLFPQYSSLSISVGLILIAIIYLNTILAVISTLVSVSRAFVTHYVTKHPDKWKDAQALFLIVPLFICLLLSFFLRAIVINIIFYAGFILAHLFGVVSL
ncbi:hypothetical protein Noda2021_11960 [Candidatus Dependentiae bacterium Noda2021]|nr:hypothetical protein Noda2021_11960 [Candidatus Dependentiae bacterium Noda2021]